ncbi:MAG: hypothetical protein ACYC5O_15900, partial [Anaerolineae bacterium]
MSERERRARTTAGLSLALALAGITFGAWSGQPLLTGLGLGGAIATIISALWYFYERGKRLTER